ncbi:MAG: serpin family protein [Candidatus Celaenobacter antarcticus]|nr:serpin family protein [Candidatus Celaenobacter antarcticus]
MKKRYICIGVLVALGMMFSFAYADAQSNLQSVVKGNNSFCFDLYQELKGEEGNLFFSPYSISTALAMTYAGARGETEKQMAQVMHYTLPQEELHPAFSILQSDLNTIEKKGDVQLNIANSLWLQKGDPFLDSFLGLNKKYYNAGLYFVNFSQSAEVRDKINVWVEDKTHDKIQDLIKPPIPLPETSLILCNAIYFKGNWLSQFDKKNTKDDDFYLCKDKTIRVPMMSQKFDYRYMDFGDFEGIELSYEGEDISMLMFLPKEIDGLSKLENCMTADTVTIWVNELLAVYERTVLVTIPKFKTICEFELARVLSDMGMPAAFSPQANFSGMNGKSGLFISNVIHKAFVDVNEEGTEAAAATAVVMLKSVAAKPLEFRADHPFIFLIRENKTGSILFIGRIVDPMK